MAKRKNILFFSDSTNARCDIRQLSKMLEGNLPLMVRLYRITICMINKLPNSYSSYLLEKKFRNPDLSRLVLFGKKDEQFPVLKLGHESYVLPNWFDSYFEGANRKPLGFLFIAAGEEILRENIAWKSIFSNWITFKNDFDYLVGFPFSHIECPKIYSAIFRQIYKHNEIGIIKGKIIDVFAEAINRISNKYEENVDDCAVAIMKLTSNQSKIVSFNQ